MSIASSKTLSFLAVCFLALGLAGLTRLSDAEQIEQTANGAIVRTAKGVLRAEICSDVVVHILANATGAPIRSLVPSVVRPCTGAQFTRSSDASHVYLRTTKLKVDISRDTGTVRFLTADGQTVLSEQPNHGRILAGAGVQPWRDEIRQEFMLSPGEAIYGLGQHQEGFLDVRDIPIRLLQANTNIAVPFLLSTKGYGLLWNNAALTDFNPTDETIQLDGKGAGTFRTAQGGDYGFLLSGNYRRRLRLSVDGEQVIDITNMWVPGSAGAKIHLSANSVHTVVAETGGNTELSLRVPSDTMAFRSETGQGVDYYFMYGPEPSQVIAQYRRYTGDAPLLPRWAYGFWQCRERYSSQQQILDTAAEFRKRQIPVDVLVQDWQYWGKYGWNAMRFDESEYPDPTAMMSALHRQDFHLVISVWAKFGAETAVDKKMVADDLVLKSAASTGEPGEANVQENWLDLFNPRAQKAFWSEINQNLFSEGLDGWWLDASEPEGDPLKSDETFLGPGKTVRNAFPLFETSAVYGGQRATNPEKRVVILSRSAYTGQQRNASISWSGDITGDWATFRRQIPAGLSFGMSGFPYWTTDIGGFFRPADQYASEDYHELLIRWFQYGAFCPIFRIHGFHSETEMWKYGPEVEKNLRKYDELRYRLFPYIYSAAWGTTSRGEIPMRALPYVYPRDMSVRDVSDQFMFGDSLLVNPVTERHATTRKLTLPAANGWVDFWTGQSQHGGQTITADAPIDQMPIFVKEGSILPMGPVVQSAADAEDPLEVRIYGGKDADFQLYEDSGDGYAYEKGERATIQLHWDDHRKLLSIGTRSGAFSGMRNKDTFRIVLVSPGHGTGIGSESGFDRSVTYDGHPTKVNLDKAL
jgi:alpha-D-xyloside xylohydrolase